MAGRRPVEADFAHLGEAAFREFRKAVGRWDRAKKKAEADGSSGGEQLLQQALAATLVVQQSWIASNVPDIAGSLEASSYTCTSTITRSGRRRAACVQLSMELR